MCNNDSWKERYEEARKAYLTLWNAAMNFIVEVYGEDALDEYLKCSICEPRVKSVYFPIVSEEFKKQGVKALEQVIASHMKKLEFEIEVKKANKNELVIVVRKCGSKSFLIENGENAKYYCRHCQIENPLYRRFGFRNRVIKTGDISCIRIYEKI